MSILRSSRVLLCVSAAILCLAGCGGAQNQVGALPGGMAQAAARSRMLPAKSGELIYAVGGCGGTCVVSYPGGQLIGALTTGGSAICSDSQGNVFISDDYDVVEYAHGGTTPTATLSLPGNLAAGCSVDPTTNNLAVVFNGSGADVAVFSNEQGSPRLYTSGIESLFCGYDDAGNLFVDGYTDVHGPQPALSKLPSGGTTFKPLTISPYIGQPGQVQWDGNHITYQAADTGEIKRLTISGSSVTVVGTTSLRKVNRRGGGASWIYGGAVLVPFPLHGAMNKTIGIWKYPKGGKATNLIKRFGSYKPSEMHFQGVTISIPPS